MINTKAVKVLKTLTNDEFKQFGKFLSSPFFNSNKSLIKLYLLLKKHYPVFEFTSEDAFKFLFPGKKYYIAKVRQLFAETYKLCEDFLAHNSLKADSFAKKYYVIKELDKKNMDNLFLANVKKLEEELNNSKIGNDLYWKRAELEYAIIDFHLVRNQHKSEYHILRRGEYYMNSIINWLHLQNAEVISIEVNYGKINKANIAEAFISNINLESFSGWLNENMRPQFTYTAIFCNLLLMNRHPENESYYFKSKKLILDNFDLFDDDLKKNLILSLRNYCTNKFDKIIFDKEVFELDKISLPFVEADFFDSGICISPIMYLNIIRNALRLNEIEWTEKFINDFTQYIHDDERENNRNSALAYLAFKKSEFVVSLKYLNQIKLTTPTIKPFFKILLLRVYYELDMIEPGLSAIDSMHHFINNTKEMNIGLKQILLSQINILNELYKLKIQPEKIDKIAILKLKDDIEKAQIRQKIWFYDKVEELEAKVASKNKRTGQDATSIPLTAE